MNKPGRVFIRNSKRRTPNWPPRKGPPPHANRLTCPLAQIILDPLAAQSDGEKLKCSNDESDNRHVAPYCDVFGTHTLCGLMCKVSDRHPALRIPSNRMNDYQNAPPIPGAGAGS